MKFEDAIAHCSHLATMTDDKESREEYLRTANCLMFINNHKSMLRGWGIALVDTDNIEEAINCVPATDWTGRVYAGICPKCGGNVILRTKESEG